MAEKIKKYLEKNKISVKKLAELSGINVRTLYSVFNYNRKITIEEYILICEALDVEVNYFMETA